MRFACIAEHALESLAVAIASLWVVSRQAASQFAVTYLLLRSKWSSSRHADYILVVVLAFVVYSAVILRNHLRQSFRLWFSQSHGNLGILLLANGCASEIRCKGLPRLILLGRFCGSKDATVVLWPVVDVSVSLLRRLGSTSWIYHSELLCGQSYICRCCRWTKWGNWRCSIIIRVALAILLLLLVIGCLIKNYWFFVNFSSTAKFLILWNGGLMLLCSKLLWWCILIRIGGWILYRNPLFRTLSWPLPQLISFMNGHFLPLSSGICGCLYSFPYGFGHHGPVEALSLIRYINPRISLRLGGR